MRKKTVVQIALGAALCMAAGGLLAFGRVQRDEGVKFREKAVAVQAELAKLEAMIGETEDEAEALRQRMEGAREQYETLQDAVDRLSLIHILCQELRGRCNKIRLILGL